MHSSKLFKIVQRLYKYIQYINMVLNKLNMSSEVRCVNLPARRHWWAYYEQLGSYYWQDGNDVYHLLSWQRHHWPVQAIINQNQSIKIFLIAPVFKSMFKGALTKNLLHRKLICDQWLLVFTATKETKQEDYNLVFKPMFIKHCILNTFPREITLVGFEPTTFA